MLIKVATAHRADSFVMFDRASQVEYHSNPQEFRNSRDLFDWLELQQDNESTLLILNPIPITSLPERDDLGNHYSRFEELIGQLSEKRVYRVNTITFQRDDKLRAVSFDTIAYICNDEGKTLERALAGGVLNY